MLSRHFLRCKALQALYAGVASKAESADEVLRIFEYNVTRLNELGLLQLSTLPQLTFTSERVMENSAQKFNPSERDRLLSTRFAENSYIKALEQCEEFKLLCNRAKVDWSDYTDTFRKVLHELNGNKQFHEYMTSEKNGREEDLAVALMAFKCLMNNDTIRAAIYDRDLLWEDDFDQIAQYNFMMIKEMKVDLTPEETPCPKMFDANNWKDAGDYEFARKLAEDAFNRLDDTEPLIRKHLNNWEMERVAMMDILLINMAVTEFTCCPSIPERVTVDEYIELSKEFSTEKSKLFINGILDKLLIELRAAGKIEKDERGRKEP